MSATERKRPEMVDADLEINLTPMIDVVFNLIIFFMVITDLSQRELEYLTLPSADNASVDTAAEIERLVVNIVDPDAPAMRGRIDLARPPIFFEGRQIASLDGLRALLRLRADPRRFPQRFEDDGVTPRAPIGMLGGAPLFPSRVPLLVRCDQVQLFGWVQAVMQICTFIPGRDLDRELVDSPLINRLEIAVSDPESSGR